MRFLTCLNAAPGNTRTRWVLVGRLCKVPLPVVLSLTASQPLSKSSKTAHCCISERTDWLKFGLTTLSSTLLTLAIQRDNVTT